MKKVGYLLLLTPALFLASCQTTPKIDTIREDEAREIISHFSKTSELPTPNKTSKVTWDIKKNDEAAWNIIKTYISTVDFERPESKVAYMDKDNDARLNNYKSELDESGDTFYKDKDALIGMNDEIYNRLYTSLPFPEDSSNSGPLFNLKYKKNGDKGLTLIIESAMQSSTWTRTHFYNESGREDRFEVNYSKGDVAYTMNIDFYY